MNFVGTALGQILYQFQMDEIRPPSGFNYLTTIRTITERYQFLEPPTDPKEIIEKGIIFGKGAITLRDVSIQVTSLGFYNDGILINTLNTDDADRLADDFMQWAINEFGMRRPITPPRRNYASQVVVDFDTSIDGLLKGFSSIVSLLNDGLRKCSNKEFDLHVARLGISGDPHVLKFPAQSGFYIEPRAGLAYRSHRYFSGAPLTTALHLDLLAQIERLLI
jgi:hypothetical protein